MGPPVMVHCKSGGSPRAGSVTTVPEPSPWGERLRPLNRLVMNSTLPKLMVSLREKASYGEHSLPMTATNTGDGIIRTARGVAHFKPPS
jgi:hypothetical protein